MEKLNEEIKDIDTSYVIITKDEIEKLMSDMKKDLYPEPTEEDMSETAPNATLTSVVSNWDVYYTQLFTAVEEEKEFPHDWSQGLSEGAVSLTKLSAYAAPKTAAKIKKVREKIESDKLHVFDISKFTVGGMWISDQDAMIDLSLTDETEDTETLPLP